YNVWRSGSPEIRSVERVVLAFEQLEQLKSASFERGTAEAGARMSRALLHRRAKAFVLNESERPGAELFQRAKAEPARAVLDDLALPSAVDHDRRATVLHRLDRGHPEVLDEVGRVLADAARVPEDRRAGVPAAQLVEGNVHAHFDGIAGARCSLAHVSQVRVV